ncbi:MAG: hypothetical protein FJ087_17420 [Deltaproteobacteria bacterium]|nr:hypothetical protein [Deltaproteobacteria bacterium]
MAASRTLRTVAISVAGALVATACTRTVELRLDPPEDKPGWTAGEERAPEPPVSSYVAPIEVGPVPSTSIGLYTILPVWRDDQRGLLADEWREALAAQAWMGPPSASERGSDYSVSVRPSYRTTWSTRPGMAVLSALVAVAGIAAGAGIGAAIDSSQGNDALTGMLVGELVGGVVGGVAAAAIPTQHHEHAWTTEVGELTDSDRRRMFQRTVTTSASYDTSAYTDSNREHSRRASALYRKAVAEGIAALHGDGLTAVRALAADKRKAAEEAEVAAFRAAEARRAAEPPRVSVAVLDLADGTRTMSRKLLDELTDYLRARLASSGRYIVIDKTRQEEAFKRVLREQQKCRLGDAYAEPSCQIPLGQAVSADAILRASVNRVGSFFYFKAELVDLTREAAVAGATARCPASPAKGRDDRMMQALDETVAGLVTPPAGGAP